MSKETTNQQSSFFIGADPEFFLVDGKGNLKSAIPVIDGTKHDQTIVDGGGLQRDNVAAEFSCDPQDSEENFVGIIGKMLGHLAKHVHPLRVHVQASTDFPEEELKHEDAKSFGCDPDFDCYSITVNEIHPSAVANTLRSCGGHIHIGEKEGLPKVLADKTGHGKLLLTKAMDFFVGITSIVLDPDKTAPRRRQLYGMAGSHRPKKYGLEYRAVGNFWTRSPDSVRLVYRLTAMAVSFCENGAIEAYLKEVGEEEVQRIINKSDKTDAQKVIEKYITVHMNPETKELYKKCMETTFDINKEWNLLA